MSPTRRDIFRLVGAATVAAALPAQVARTTSPEEAAPLTLHARFMQIRRDLRVTFREAGNHDPKEWDAIDRLIMWAISYTNGAIMETCPHDRETWIMTPSPYHPGRDATFECPICRADTYGPIATYGLMPRRGA